MRETAMSQKRRAEKLRARKVGIGLAPLVGFDGQFASKPGIAGGDSSRSGLPLDLHVPVKPRACLGRCQHHVVTINSVGGWTQVALEWVGSTGYGKSIAVWNQGGSISGPSAWATCPASDAMHSQVESHRDCRVPRSPAQRYPTAKSVGPLRDGHYALRSNRSRK